MSSMYTDILNKARAGMVARPGRGQGSTHRHAATKMKQKREGGGKGEGSRGGKVIGHTPSGRPIYAPSGKMSGAYSSHKKKGDYSSAKKWGKHAVDHIESHGGYSKEDHEYAADAHMKRAKKHYKAGRMEEAHHHAKISKLHRKRAMKKSQDVGDGLRKGKKYPIGTVRTHGGVKKKKTAQGWVPVGPSKKKKKKGREMSPELAAYWSGSASASIHRDYQSGNVRTIHAGPSPRQAEDEESSFRRKLEELGAQVGLKPHHWSVGHKPGGGAITSSDWGVSHAAGPLYEAMGRPTGKRVKALAARIEQAAAEEAISVAVAAGKDEAEERDWAQWEIENIGKRNPFSPEGKGAAYRIDYALRRLEDAYVDNAQPDQRLVAERRGKLRAMDLLREIMRDEQTKQTKQTKKSSMERLTMKKAITLYDAVQIAKAMDRVTGDPSLETAGGKGASLDDAESFSIPKAKDDEKKKKKKKRKKKWKIPGSVPA